MMQMIFNDVVYKSMNDGKSIAEWPDKKVCTATANMLAAMDENLETMAFEFRYEGNFSYIDTLKEPFYLFVRPINWVAGHGWGARVYRQNLEEKYYEVRGRLQQEIKQAKAKKAKEQAEQQARRKALPSPTRSNLHCRSLCLGTLGIAALGLMAMNVAAMRTWLL